MVAYPIAAVIQSFFISIFASFGIWIIFKTKKRIRNQDYNSKQFSINQKLILVLFGVHFCLGFTRLCHHTAILICGEKAKVVKYCFLTQQLISSLEIIYTTVIPIERFVTIRFPFHSRTYEQRNQRIYLFVFPLVMVCLFIVSISYSGFGIILPFTLIVSGILTIILCNILLYRIVRRQTKQIAMTRCSLPENWTENCKKPEIQDRRRGIQKRSFKICSLMTLTYVLLWVPFLSSFYLAKFEVYKSVLLTNILGFLAYLNPIIDVLIYLFWSTETRRTLRVIFGFHLNGCNDRERTKTDVTIVDVEL